MNRFLTTVFFVSFFCCNTLFSWAQQSISIDVKADVKPISPLIYGANNPTTNATAIRWGGNRTTAYNWENNFSNAGEDYNNISDRFFLNGVSTQEQSIPAIPIVNMVRTANTRKQYTLVTLQAAGFVAADANGAVTLEQIAPSSRWDSVVFRKGSVYSLNPDKTDGKVYIDEMVNYLNQSLGAIGSGGIDAFGIDNEPALWGSTHPLIRPNKLTMNELFYKTREVASVVKELSPKADVYGPMFYSWSDMYMLNMDNYVAWNAIKSARGYWGFVDYYLDSLKNVEQEYGKRLLDVLSIHWYPEAKGTSTNLRIVDLIGTSTEAQLTAPDMITARLQAPRSLWDETYIENSYLTGQHGALRLIKRLQNSINQYYPGTKLAFTEFKYDAEYHFSGGLALADVLGVFGREGVYMASKWDPINNDFGGAAYKLYLNYNNEGGRFGNTSVRATTTNNAAISTFASLDENNNLHVVVINKTSSQQTTQFGIANGYYSHGQVYGFDQTDKTIREFAAVSSISNSGFEYALPAYSALHFVLYAKPQVQVLAARVLPANASQIVLKCSQSVEVTNSTQAIAEITVTNTAGTNLTVTNIVASQNFLIVTLNNPIDALDSLCTISFSGISIVGDNQLPIASFQSVPVYNLQESSPLFVRNATVVYNGKSIVLNLSKQITDDAQNSNGILLQVNSQTLAIDSIRLSDQGFSLVLYPSQRILKEQIVQLTSTIEDIESTDGKVISEFSVTATNNGPNVSPAIDSIVIKNNFLFTAFVNNRLDATNFTNAGFVLYEDGVSIPFTATYVNQQIVFTTQTPMLKEKVYTLSYVDTDKIMTIFGGYLNGFENASIINRLKPTPDYIDIPSQIEAEDYAYHKSSSVLESTNDIGGGVHVGFIGTNDIYAYHITVPETKNYTVTLRHSGASQDGTVLFKVNGVTKARMFVPKTGSWNVWKNSSVVLPLEAGDITIEMHVLATGFNANWLSFAEGENPSNALLVLSQTDNAGENVYLFFDRKLRVLPQISEIQLTNNSVPLQITNISYVGNDSTKLQLQIQGIIYKNNVISVTYNQTSAVTTENGILQPVSSVQVSNKSTQINSQIELIQAGITISHVNNTVCIESVDNIEYTYSIYTIHGKLILKGVGYRNTSISIEKQGIYVVEVETIKQKICKKIRIE